jgi:hypothetical protein
MTSSQKQQTTAVEWPTRKQEEWDLGSVTTEYALNGKLSRRKLMFLKQAFEREIQSIQDIAAAFETHQHTLNFSFIAKEEILKGLNQWGFTAMAALILDKELPVEEPEWPHIDVYDDAIACFGI